MRCSSPHLRMSFQATVSCCSVAWASTSKPGAGRSGLSAELTGANVALGGVQVTHSALLQATPLVVFVQRGDDRARHFTNLNKVVRMVQKQLKLRTRWDPMPLAAPADACLLQG